MDVKSDSIFTWLTDHTKVLPLSQAQEQSMKAASEVGEKFYKLRRTIDTRLPAYFEGLLATLKR
jgi:hypothetical protein